MASLQLRQTAVVVLLCVPLSQLPRTSCTVNTPSALPIPTILGHFVKLFLSKAFCSLSRYAHKPLTMHRFLFFFLLPPPLLLLLLLLLLMLFFTNVWCIIDTPFHPHPTAQRVLIITTTGYTTTARTRVTALMATQGSSAKRIGTNAGRAPVRMAGHVWTVWPTTIVRVRKDFPVSVLYTLSLHTHIHPQSHIHKHFVGGASLTAECGLFLGAASS